MSMAGELHRFAGPPPGVALSHPYRGPRRTATLRCRGPAAARRRPRRRDRRLGPLPVLPSRDELLTDLIVAAFDEHADAVEAAGAHDDLGLLGRAHAEYRLDPDTLRRRAARLSPGTAERRALEVDLVSVTKIASMLEKAVENTAVPAPRAATASARFARDAGEYASTQRRLRLVHGGTASASAGTEA